MQRRYLIQYVEDDVPYIVQDRLQTYDDVLAWIVVDNGLPDDTRVHELDPETGSFTDRTDIFHGIREDARTDRYLRERARQGYPA